MQSDEGAYTKRYRRRQAAGYRFALHMAGDAVIAENVTQEVFLTLLEQGCRYDPARGQLQSSL